MSEVVLTRKDFRAFAEVRKSGLYNMFDPKAREMTHLSEEQWVAIIEQYAELENKYKENRN